MYKSLIFVLCEICFLALVSLGKTTKLNDLPIQINNVGYVHKKNPYLIFILVFDVTGTTSFCPPTFHQRGTIAMGIVRADFVSG